MPDEHYINPKLASVYDLDCPWGEDKDFYLNLADQGPLDILDLGCGTGQLCFPYATAGHRVVGVDPAGAMLDVARKKPNAANIEWVQSNAQDFRSAKRFDLIIMTGHAFQVLLGDEDVMQVFTTVRERLKPTGRFVFESRNPEIDWAYVWDYQINLQSRSGTIQENRRFTATSKQGEFMTFEISYAFSDEALVSRSTLRFMSRDRIQECLERSGLSTSNFYGDWNRQLFNPLTSHEMIFEVVRK